MPPDPTASDATALDRVIAAAMAGDGELAARRWAASGAMALTGPADGPADVGPARVALAMDALAADAGLRAAWDALSSSRRREAAEHIASAKRDETRARRLEELLTSLR